LKVSEGRRGDGSLGRVRERPAHDVVGELVVAGFGPAQVFGVGVGVDVVGAYPYQSG